MDRLANRVRIARVLARGLSTADAAAELGLSERSVQRWQIELGVRERQVQRTYDPEWEQKAEALLDEGAPYSAVAEIVGVPRGRVQSTFPGRGMSLHDAGIMGYAHLKQARERKQRMSV